MSNQKLFYFFHNRLALSLLNDNQANNDDHGDESGSSSGKNCSKRIFILAREDELNIYLFDWFFKQVRMITPDEHSKSVCVYTEGNFRLALKERVSIIMCTNVMHCLRRKNDDYIGCIAIHCEQSRTRNFSCMHSQ